jgi:p-aminobenzoyl-glutamate transporter AbgT
MKAWVNGGLIGALFGIILFFYIRSKSFFIICKFGPCQLDPILQAVDLLVLIIFFFVIGSILGWIVGKIKAKKN